MLDNRSMQTIGNILQDRFKAYKENPKLALKNRSTEYQKKWNEGVNYFLLEINKDRKKDGMNPVTFITVRTKLIALVELSDLRWFFFCCKKYATTKDKLGNQNTFSKCFWGALKTK